MADSNEIHVKLADKTINAEDLFKVYESRVAFLQQVLERPELDPRVRIAVDATQASYTDAIRMLIVFAVEAPVDLEDEAQYRELLEQITAIAHGKS